MESLSSSFGSDLSATALGGVGRDAGLLGLDGGGLVVAGCTSGLLVPSVGDGNTRMLADSSSSTTVSICLGLGAVGGAIVGILGVGVGETLGAELGVVDVGVDLG